MPSDKTEDSHRHSEQENHLNRVESMDDEIIIHGQTILIIIGLSGSGKTTFLKALEDGGYYCIDRLPLPLLTKVIQLSTTQSGGHHKGFAFGVDSFSTNSLKDLPKLIQYLKALDNKVQLIYLFAENDILIRRYSTTRRPHPAGKSSLQESIQVEKAFLEEIRSAADTILDTSHFNVHALKKHVINNYCDEEHSGLTTTITSFGFKHGIPTSCDILFDVRFLKNPYFIESLREQRGTDQEVQEFVLKQVESNKVLELFDSINDFIPFYEREGKSYLNIGIGCTGGHHRSVAIAEAIAKKWRTLGRKVYLQHRDINQ